MYHTIIVVVSQAQDPLSPASVDPAILTLAGCAWGCFCGLPWLAWPVQPITDKLAFHLNNGGPPSHAMDHQDHQDHSVSTKPRTDNSLSLQTVITAIAIASADLKPVVRPSGGGKQARVRGIPTLGPRKFQQRRLSVPPTPQIWHLPETSQHLAIDDSSLPQDSSNLCRLSLYAFYCPVEPSIRKTLPT